jgi:hypothetical protein
VDGFWRDLRLGLRALKASPVVTIVATLSIALGIGANTAIFSLIDSLILRKLPVADPDRLVLVTTTTPQGARAWSYPVWKELWASGSFFEMLRVAASLGRVVGPSDDRDGGGPDGPVVVIGHQFWQRHFGGAPDVIGRTLTLDDVPYTTMTLYSPRRGNVRRRA